MPNQTRLMPGERLPPIERHLPGMARSRSLKMIAVRAAFVSLSVRMDVATIEREALSLTVAERALLADRLLQTLDHIVPMPA